MTDHTINENETDNIREKKENENLEKKIALCEKAEEIVAQENTKANFPFLQPGRLRI